MTSTTQYNYDEAAMMAGIAAWKRETQAALDERIREMGAEQVRRQDAERAQRVAVCAESRQMMNPMRVKLRRTWRCVPILAERRSMHDVSALPSWARICCALVCEEFQINLFDLTRLCNERPTVRPRQIAMHLMVKVAGASYPKAGACLGGLHHTTVMYGLRVVERERFVDAKFRAVVEKLEALAMQSLGLR